MSGFGSGSLFRQQANTQGAGAFGNQSQAPATNSFGFGAKRTQSFDTSSPSAPKPFGFSAAAQSPSPFGQANTSQNTNPGSGLFGGSGTASGKNNGSGLFGATTTSNLSANTGGMFGTSTNTNLNTASGGLFGNNNKKPMSGFSFGNTASLPANGAANGLGASASKPLFGSAATSTIAAPNAPGFGFNVNSTNNASGSGVFGNTGSTAQPGAIFGNPATIPNNSGSLFGKPPTASLFGQSQQQQSQQQPIVPQQQLQTGVDQASYVLPGVSPSQKLYSSLSVQSSKRDHAESEALNFEPKTSVLRNRFAFASHRTSFAGDSPHKGVAGFGTPLSDPLATKSAFAATNRSVISTNTQGEPRKWINSYEKFVRERPTTLTIKRHDRKRNLTSLAARESAPVAAEPPAIASDLPGNASVSFNPTAESSFREDQDEGSNNEPDVSMFHRQANNMTLVRVNRQAIDEGYYIYPRLEDLAAMSKQQLLRVEHLVVGREGFGKIEYPEAVDLSRIPNLGDILGVLVIFGPGTVCVYPDEGSKMAPGKELNMPCIVSIENAWPRDSINQKIIKDVDDPRMSRHIHRLRNACESRGGEFVTFTQGIWVFKVPHFSTWGLPTSEMMIGEEDSEETDIRARPLKSELGLSTSINVAADEDMPDNEAAPHLTSSPIIAVTKSGQLEGQRLTDAQFATNAPDAVIAEGDLPQTWQDQLIHASNGILLAASGSLLAASEPTSKLDLEDILDPLWKKSGRDNMENAEDAKPLKDTSRSSAFNAKAASTQLVSLRPFIRITPRQTSNLPHLHTAIRFQDIGTFQGDRKSLWQLLSILYDNNETFKDVDIGRLSRWLDSEVHELTQNTQGTALEKIWQLVSCHDLHTAYNLALKSNNVHLALLVSLLGETASKESLKADAERQLSDWETSHAVNSIPLSVLRIWEVAAGKVPTSARFTWKQWLGLQFWYCEERTVERAIQALPRTYSALKEPELVFLECFAGKKQLRTAVNELDSMEGFLCLQAMLTNRPSAVMADLKCLDNVCAKLATLLDQAGDAVGAIYTGLHISDTKLALKTVRSILQKGSTTICLPPDFGVPEEFLNESRANQVARQGQFTAQAEYLLRAGLFNDAHKVIVSEAAPNAVLSGSMPQLVDILESLEKAKDKVKRWEFGGNVYLTYARALSQEPDQYTVTAMCNALRYIDTPSLKSQKAVSRIAEWLASTSAAKSTLTSQLLLKMKFDTSQLRVQSLQEASRLLQSTKY